MSKVGRARLQLGEAAILSLAETVRLLPLDNDEARAWLEAHALVRSLMGRPVVVWGDVVLALRGETLAPSVAAPEAVDPWRGLKRAEL